MKNNILRHSLKKRTSKSKKQRGFSLVEVIVAMALTVLISFVAFMVCNTCINLGSANHTKNYFVLETDNYLKAYYLGSGDYEDAMNMLTNQNFTYGENASIHYDSKFNITTEETYSYIVDLTFASKFKVECKKASGETIYKVEV